MRRKNLREMRTALSWAAWFGPLFGLWLAFVGVTSGAEVVAGLAAAAVGATAAEVVRRCGLLSYRPPPGLAAAFARQLWRTVRDFLLLVWLLFPAMAGHRSRSAFRTIEVNTRGDSPSGRGWRAFAGWVGSIAPNTIVVDLDEGTVLRHELVPGRSPDDPLR